MTLKKRSVKISGHDTSVSLEDEFWTELKNIADKKNISLNKLISDIDISSENEANLASAIRVYILNHIRKNSV